MVSAVLHPWRVALTLSDARADVIEQQRPGNGGHAAVGNEGTEEEKLLVVLAKQEEHEVFSDCARAAVHCCCDNAPLSLSHFIQPAQRQCEIAPAMRARSRVEVAHAWSNICSCSRSDKRASIALPCTIRSLCPHSVGSKQRTNASRRMRTDRTLIEQPCGR